MRKILLLVFFACLFPSLCHAHDYFTARYNAIKKCLPPDHAKFAAIAPYGIKLLATTDSNGVIRRLEIVGRQITYLSNPRFREAGESIVRAVMECERSPEWDRNARFAITYPFKPNDSSDLFWPREHLMRYAYLGELIQYKWSMTTRGQPDTYGGGCPALSKQLTKHMDEINTIIEDNEKLNSQVIYEDLSTILDNSVSECTKLTYWRCDQQQWHYKDGSKLDQMCQDFRSRYSRIYDEILQHYPILANHYLVDPEDTWLYRRAVANEKRILETHPELPGIWEKLFGE